MKIKKTQFAGSAFAIIAMASLIQSPITTYAQSTLAVGASALTNISVGSNASSSSSVASGTMNSNTNVKTDVSVSTDSDREIILKGSDARTMELPLAQTHLSPLHRKPKFLMQSAIQRKSQQHQTLKFLTKTENISRAIIR